ncbi:MAG: sulfide dehydrogenase [Gemmatimonadetes bacterium]|nr:sulfide dehydrogenase [Gemmatimonadota bacterium]MBI2616036.1 sulfide dehydrogenase [Gemmatimonadota bacterium]MBI3082251.1 sulfide dehydrogenase [Gemmatimonadota bacterium]
MKGARIALVLAAMVVGAAPVVQQASFPPGVVRAGEYRVSPPAGPAAVVAGAVYDVGPFPLNTPELAPGEGRDPTVAMCSVCHSVRYITMQPPLPPEVWQAMVRKMIDVHGAPIPDDAARQITVYLQAHYGTRTR